MKQRNLCCALIGMMIGLVSMAAEAPLPAGYETVPYIESTGTQWINPDYNLAADTTIEAEFSHLKWGEKANVTLFGGSFWGNGSAILNMRTSKAAGLIGYLGTNTVTFAYNYDEEDRCTIVAASSGNEDSVFINKTTNKSTRFTAGTISNASALGKPFHIFKPAAKQDSDGYNSSYRLYSMKLSDDGKLRRDLVPARRLSDGELGLYDRVSDNFYLNAGTGKFRTEGTTGHRLTYIRSNGNQKIDGFWTTTDTGYQFDFWFGDWEMLSANGGACVYLGCGTWGDGWLINSNNGQAKNLNYFGFKGNVNLVPNGNMGNETYYFHLNNADGSTSIAKEGETLKQNAANGNLIGASGKSLSLFGLAAKPTTGQIVGTYGYSKYSFYGIKVTDTVSHEFVPYLQPDGETAGIADVAGEIPNFKAGTSNFTDHGLAYDLVEGAAQFSVGTMTAADKRALDSGAVAYTTFEKASRCVLNTAAIENFAKPVKVLAGTWSLTNGKAAVQTVPALTLTGGATLAFDVIGGASDTIDLPETAAVAFAAATAENPVKIVLNAVEPDLTASFTLISHGLEADLDKFELADASGYSGFALSIQNGSLVLTCVETHPVVAKWEFSGESWGWVFYDRRGNVTDEEPDAEVTELVVPAGTTDFSWSTPLPAHKGGINFEATDGAFALPADADWSALDLSLVAPNQTIDLKSHTLTLASGLAADLPALTFTDTTVAGDGVTVGKLIWSVPENAVATNAAYALTGSLQLEKQGAGTLVLSKSGQTYAGGTLVSAGIVKLNVTGGVSTANAVTVASGAAFDVNGIPDTPARYVIAGTGPDGKGALRNTGNSIDATKAQMAGLELAGDALITATGHFGLVNSSYESAPLELNEHVLTLDYVPSAGFWLCHATSSSTGTVHVVSGVPYFHAAASTLSSVDFIIDGANALLRMPAGGPDATIGSATFVNGGILDEHNMKLSAARVAFLEPGLVNQADARSWLYVTSELFVSNGVDEVTELTVPVQGTAKLVKEGAGTFFLNTSNNRNLINGGAEIRQGKVKLGACGETQAPWKSISENAVPVTIRNGAALDISGCGTTAVPVTTLTLDGGAGLDLAQTSGGIACETCSFGETVSAENPVLVDVAGGLSGRTLVLTCAKLTDEDVARFAYKGSDISAVFFVENGSLYIGPDSSPVTMEWDAAEEKWVCKGRNGRVVDSEPDPTQTRLLMPSPAVDVAEGTTVFSIEPVTGDTIELDKATDWSGLDLGKIRAGTVIDLKGNDLAVTSSNGTVATSVTFTDTTERGGTLTLTVPEGAKTKFEASVAFAGSLTLAKAGAGALDFSNRRTFECPFVLNAGTLDLADGETRTFSFASLTLKGGAALALGRTKAIRPATLVLPEAGETPVRVALDGAAQMEEQILIGGGLLVADDLGAFASDPDGATLAIHEGNLVCQTKILPEGYVMLPYVESLGGGSAAHVDTGIGPSLHIVYSNDSGSQYNDRPIMRLTFSPTRAASDDNGYAYFGSFNKSGYLNGSLALRMAEGKFQSILCNNNTTWSGVDTGVAPTPGRKYTVTLSAAVEKGQTTVSDEASGEILVRKTHSLAGRNTFLVNSILIGRAYSDGLEWGAAARYYRAQLTVKSDVYTYSPALELSTGRIGFYCTGKENKFLPSAGSHEFGYLRGRVVEGTLVARDGLLAPSYTYSSETGDLGIGAFDSLVKEGPYPLRLKNYATKGFAAVTLAEGTLDLADGVTGVHSFGAFALAGGATLRMDVAGTAADVVDVTSLDLSGASAENKAVIALAGTLTQDIPLITGGDLTTADLEKIDLVGEIPEALVLQVIDGDLWLANPNRPVLIRWGDDEAAWTFFNANGERIPSEDVVWDNADQQVPLVMPAALQVIPEDVLRHVGNIRSEVPVAFAENTDWSAIPFAKLGPGLTLDLMGHDLALTGANGTCAAAITITDSSAAGEGGTLTITVPEGESMNNTGLSLTGSLKFVKAGAGSFTMSKGTQTYTGGTLVSGGLLTTPVRKGVDDLTYAPFETGFIPFGERYTPIEIGTNGTFDIAGNYCYAKYAIVLAGGTLKNSVTQGNVHDSWLSIGNLTLTADSTLLSVAGTHLGANKTTDNFVANLGGHVLDIQITAGDFYNDPLHLLKYAFTNGTVRVSKGGWFRVGAAGDPWKDCTLEYQSGALDFDANLTVENLVQEANTDNTSGWNKRNAGRLIVTGTYKPVADYYHNFTLKSGVTIDLTEHAAPFVIAPAYDLREGQGKSTFEFEANGTFVLRLGKIPPTGTRVIDWSAQQPAEWQNLKFVDPTGRCGFLVTADGVEVRSGMAIFIR